MNLLLVSPIVLPLLVSAFLFLIKGKSCRHATYAVAATLLSLILSCFLLAEVQRNGIHTLQAGDWAAPFGITLVADRLSSVMNVVVAFLGFCVALYSKAEIHKPQLEAGYFSAFFGLLAGSSGVLLAGDIFNMYVWVEVMVISSFMLLSMGESKDQIKSSMPYVIINIFASVLILIGIGMTFGLAGTVNIADLSLKVSAGLDTKTLSTTAIIFFAGFGIKAALFPLFFWLPDAYTSPPVSVSALFAGLYTKVAVCAIIRLFTLIFPLHNQFLHSVILWSSIVTMVIGVLGAVAQNEIRRLLSFHIVSQVGYMTFGLAISTQAGIAASIYFIIHNILAKANLFLIGGIAEKALGTFQLKKMGGLFQWSPALSVLFFISAYSLGGIPPLSGFWGKLTLTRAAFLSGEFFGGAVCLFVGLLTIFSMTKIWLKAFWKPRPEENILLPEVQQMRNFMIPTVLLAAVSLAIGLFPDILLSISEQAAAELLDPSAYIQTVFGGKKQ